MESPLPIGMPPYDNYGCHQPPLTTILVHSLAEKVARLLKPESAKMPAPVIQSALLDVKQAAVYLGGYPMGACRRRRTTQEPYTHAVTSGG